MDAIRQFFADFGLLGVVGIAVFVLIVVGMVKSQIDKGKGANGDGQSNKRNKSSGNDNNPTPPSNGQ